MAHSLSNHSTSLISFVSNDDNVPQRTTTTEGELDDDEQHDGEESDSDLSDLDHLKRAFDGQLYHGQIVLWSYHLNKSCLEFILEQTTRKYRPRRLRGIAFRECTFEESQDTTRVLAQLLEQGTTNNHQLRSLEITGGMAFANLLESTQQYTARAVLQSMRAAEMNGIKEMHLNFVNLCGRQCGHDLGTLLQSPYCTIRQLHLICPSMNRDTLQGFLDAGQRNDTVEELEMEHNGNVGMEHLLPFILRFQSLKKFDLVDTELSVSSLPHLTNLIERHDSLECLDMTNTGNLFGGRHPSHQTGTLVERFAKSLGRNDTLQFLGLKRCGIGASTATCLLRELESNGTLSTLDLRLNPIDFEEHGGTAAWAGHLTALTTLSSFFLPAAGGTQFDEQDWLAKHLKKNVSITNLQCGSSPLCLDLVMILERNRLIQLAERMEPMRMVPTVLWPHLTHRLSMNHGEASPLYHFLLPMVPELLSRHQQGKEVGNTSR